VLRKENSLIYEEQNFPTRGIHPTDLVRYYILYPTELVSECRELPNITLAV